MAEVLQTLVIIAGIVSIVGVIGFTVIRHHSITRGKTTVKQFDKKTQSKLQSAEAALRLTELRGKRELAEAKVDEITHLRYMANRARAENEDFRLPQLVEGKKHTEAEKEILAITSDCMCGHPPKLHNMGRGPCSSYDQQHGSCKCQSFRSQVEVL